MDEESELYNAKNFLLKSSTDSGLNLYDHLAELLNNVLEKRQSNSVDIIESISQEIKSNKQPSINDNLIDLEHISMQVDIAKSQRKLFEEAEQTENFDDPNKDTELETQLPNLMQHLYFFEQAGVGLGREEIFCIWLSMKSLLDSQPDMETIRFWGKVFGLKKNYYIVETQMRDGSDDNDDEDERDGEDDGENEEKIKNEDDDEEEIKIQVDIIPKPNYKKVPNVAKEPKGTGTNKNQYFVCNELGTGWIKLPSVTPAQISCARKIRKFFSGDLNAEIICYPPFPGQEINFLRAQIARISSGTQISPLGFYQFDEEDEDENENEDGTTKRNFIANPDFESIPAKELAEASLTNWVHHVLNILPQGRTSWWNPLTKNEINNENDEDDNEKEENEAAIIEPEIGPPLLTPLSEDVDIDGLIPWVARVSSTFMSKHAIAYVQSCLWPGAYAYCSEKSFENIYIGWGLKHLERCFNEKLPDSTMQEYLDGPENLEIDDPTPQQEEELNPKAVGLAGSSRDGGENGDDDDNAENEDNEEEDDD